jgi:arylsulfatase A-like enzyme
MENGSCSRRNFLKTAFAAGTVSSASNDKTWADPSVAISSNEQCGSVWERPARQTGNALNLIVIVSDTFRHDNLKCYGPKWMENLETPNLDRFAEKAVIFQDAYAEGMPTIVIRRTLYTGRRAIPAYYFAQHEDDSMTDVQLPGWHALYNEDVTLSETLLECGYLTKLISSLHHQFKPGRNFHRGFHSWEWVRGLEFDYYGTSPHELIDVSDLVSSEYLNRFPGLHTMLSQYKANKNQWKQKGESVSQITAEAAIRWLNENHDQRPFYLHVEFFDPHEPWDPPTRFLQRYASGASTPKFVEPPYDTVPLSDEIKNRFRTNYAGAASCTDFWIGALLDRIEQFGLFDNSVVLFMSDHGAMLGEHGQFVKGPDKLRGQVTQVPLLIRTPGNPYSGKRVPGFVQIPDVMPTVLSLLDLKPPSRVTGHNVWPLVTGASSSRDRVVQTYGWVGAVRTNEWSYSEIWKPEAQQDKYSVLPGAPPGIYRPQLYNLATDPKELTDVVDKYRDIAREMSAKMKEYFASREGTTFGSFNERPSLDTFRRSQGGIYAK